MGLYGALVVGRRPEAYPASPMYQEQVLVFSEIDPPLTPTLPAWTALKVIKWRPKYFLINGQAYDPSTPPIGINVGDDVLLRFVNAGLDTLMPTLGGGLYMDLKAEDGNLYPYPIEQYGLEFQAGKTIDAVVKVATPAPTHSTTERFT